MCTFQDAAFATLGTIPACDRQMDGHVAVAKRRASKKQSCFVDYAPLRYHFWQRTIRHDASANNSNSTKSDVILY